jgi:predicted amidophosphoribosyltransferase
MRPALARARVLRMGAAILSRVVDALLPRLCLSCDAIVATPGLCAACWARQRWLAPPHCAACGLPAGAEGEAMAPGWTCAACTVRRAAPRRTRAALRYDAASRELALRLKHADALHAAPGFAAWMRAAGAELLDEADLLVPVPLHWTRLAWRRFNQAAVLARLVARGAGAPRRRAGSGAPRDGATWRAPSRSPRATARRWPGAASCWSTTCSRRARRWRPAPRSCSRRGRPGSMPSS